MREEARRQAAMAFYTNRSPPPRFRPGIIIAAVIITGVLVIGIIMTIVAYLPGYSAEGVDTLRIVSPIIFAVGALALIILIVFVCIRSGKERKLFEKNLHEISAASRATLASRRSDHSTPPAGGKPQRSILKQGSTSTYGGRDDQDSSGNNYSQQNSAASSFEGSSGSQNRSVHYNISMKPEPYGHNNRNNPPARHSNTSYGSATDADTHTKPRYQQPAYNMQNQGRHSSSSSERHQRIETYDNGGYDAYDNAKITGQGMLSPNKSYSGENLPGATSRENLRAANSRDNIRSPNSRENLRLPPPTGGKPPSVADHSMRAVSPASTASGATPRRWGQASGHNTSQGSSVVGMHDQSKEKVSVVTELYRDIQPGPLQSQTTTVTTTRQYEKQIPQQSAATRPPLSAASRQYHHHSSAEFIEPPSGSTEV